jgi:glutathione S-transferase
MYSAQDVRLYDYSASGNCYKVRLLLALLDRPYERVPVDIFAGDTLTPEYAELNPTRRTPVLQLDDGQIVHQSNAILVYLAAGSDYLPESPLDRALTVQWLIFEQEWILPGIAGPRFVALTDRVPADVIRRHNDHGRRALDMLESQLADRQFVTGQTASIADVSLFAYAHVAGDVGLELVGWPAVEGWTRRVEALPGFMNDLEPYPANARPESSRSIYDG